MAETRQQRRQQERTGSQSPSVELEVRSWDRTVSKLAGSGALAAAAAVFGNVMPSMGQDGLWFMAACFVLAGGLYSWGHYGRRARLVLVLAVVGFLTLGYKGYRAVTGADRILNWAVCGQPVVDDKGHIIAFNLEIDEINRTDKRMWSTLKSQYIVFGDQPGKPAKGKLEGALDVNSTYGNWAEIVFAHPIPAEGRVKGQLRYVFKYGENETHPDKRLVVSGSIEMDFEDNGRLHSTLRFMPDEDASTGIEKYCDLKEAPWNKI